MPEIQVLSEDVISRIAAGEVIERPASALKELLENSLDAGARSITIDIEKAGKALLRVRDDGRGMVPEDCRLSLTRHSTSKIRSFSDLDRLSTFGFRGEALYSIAAVSRLDITSCRKGKTAVGWSVKTEGGRVISESEAPPVPGTTVEVRDLFFNTPARSKFLRSDPSERSHLLRAAEECALANCGTAFHFRADGTEVFSLPHCANESLDSVFGRARLVLGKTAAEGLLAAASEPLGIKALASGPGSMVATRGAQYFFVNKRPVSSRTLQQALYKAYEPFRANGKHPACVIFIEIPPDEFDVNIHPQKRDVRFRNESAVFKAVSSVIGERLLKERRPVQIIPAVENSGTGAPGGVFEKSEGYSPAAPPSFTPAAALEQELPIMPESSGGPAWYNPPFRFLGQLEKSYLVFESNGGLLLVDQHAAAERVIFEKYMEQLSAGATGVQPLMLPVSVDLSPSQMENSMRWKQWLSSAGFEIQQFGAGTILLHSVPAVFDFGPNDLREFLERLSEILGDPEKCSEEVKRETVATLACKKAVKAHDHLKAEEALRLIEDLRVCKDSFTCPHGRPAVLSLSRAELARRFHRPGPPPK